MILAWICSFLSWASGSQVLGLVSSSAGRCSKTRQLLIQNPDTYRKSKTLYTIGCSVGLTVRRSSVIWHWPESPCISHSFLGISNGSMTGAPQASCDDEYLCTYRFEQEANKSSPLPYCKENKNVKFRLFHQACFYDPDQSPHVLSHCWVTEWYAENIYGKLKPFLKPHLSIHLFNLRNRSSTKLKPDTNWDL